MIHSTHNAITSTLFFFNDTATTEIYTLSLHDALPICEEESRSLSATFNRLVGSACVSTGIGGIGRSEEHTSELQSRLHLVCRLLLEKKRRQRFPRPRRDTWIESCPPAPSRGRRRGMSA